MSQNIPPEDLRRLEQSLLRLAGHLDGALDFWTLVCLGDLPLDRRAFLTQRGGEMHALVGEVKDVFLRAGVRDVEPIGSHLSNLSLACDKLGRAFLVLEQFRVLPREAVRLATTSIAEVYADLRRAILGIGQAAGLAIHYWEGQRADQEGYFQQILNGLYDQCAHERGAEQRSAVAGHTV